MGDRVGIVGGGAAGMMAAIAAAGQGARVTLLEGNDRLGKKILSTGNGKCNLGNEDLSTASYYTGRPELLEGCLQRFGTEDTVDFFRGIGLELKSRRGGLYPLCEQASAVLDALRFQVRASGAEVVTGCKIREIGRDSGRGIWLAGEGHSTEEGHSGHFLFDRVVLACGGRAAPKTGSDGNGYRLAEQLGHKLVPTVPALVPLRCREEYLKSVAGVRAEAQISIYRSGRGEFHGREGFPGRGEYRDSPVARERGELQLTESGISGIPVFQLSRQVNYLLREAGGEAQAVIDFLPDDTEESFGRLCAGRRSLREGRSVEEFFTGLLNRKLMLLFIRLAGLKPTEDAEKADERKIDMVYSLCRRWSLHVIGNAGYDSAQACAGGIPLDQVTADLESRIAPGVYFAGEMLDVDGRCGGYNLQWAWCSGWLAGRGAAGGGRVHR